MWSLNSCGREAGRAVLSHVAPAAPRPGRRPAEDRAILALEGPGLVGHTCKLIRLAAGAPGAEALREALTRQLPDVPQLAWRLAGPADAPVWRPDEAFDVGQHVRA